MIDALLLDEETLVTNNLLDVSQDETLKIKLYAVNDPLEAFSRLRSNQNIRTVISDLHMPLINGVQFLEKVRIDFPKHELFLISGKHPTDEEDCRLKRIDGKFFRKSLSYHNLLLQITNYEYDKFRRKVILGLNSVEFSSMKIFVGENIELTNRELIREIISNTEIGKEYLEVVQTVRTI
jgi:CheY-like chemotaxis protein